jgi:hypothetical protein
MIGAIIAYYHPEMVIGFCMLGYGSLSPHPGMRQYIGFGYGSLAPHFTDEEVLAKCRDLEFQKWYHGQCATRAKDNYTYYKKTVKGIRYYYYSVPDDPRDNMMSYIYS